MLEFLLKNRDTLNTKHFQNFIVYYLLLKFLCCFIVLIRDFIKKIEIFEIQNFKKIPSSTISF